MENTAIKADSIKPLEMVPQTLPPAKKPEPIRTIEIQESEDRLEHSTFDYFAPVPVATPLGN